MVIIQIFFRETEKFLSILDNEAEEFLISYNSTAEERLKCAIQLLQSVNFVQVSAFISC